MAEYINKYTDNAAYVADASGRASLGKSTVSLEDDTRKVHFDGVNVELPEGVVPSVGDALWVDSNGGKHFYAYGTVKHSDLTAKNYSFVGIVAMRKGHNAWVLHKSETETKFINAWCFKITGYSAGTPIKCKQYKSNDTTEFNEIDIGFTPTATDVATVSAFATALNTKLRANQPTVSASGLATNWSAAVMKDATGTDSVFMFIEGDSSSGIYYSQRQSPIASGATATLYVWELVGLGTNYTNINRDDNVDTWACLWNKSRFENYNQNVNSPTDSITSGGLYSKSNFTYANCPTVYTYYGGDYDKYMDAMLMRSPASTGALAAFYGQSKLICDKAKAITFTSVFTSGSKPLFKAISISANVTDYGANLGWYMPGIEECKGIYEPMLVNGSDRVNTAFVQSNGSVRSLSVTRWVPARYTYYNAWLLYNYGYMYSYYFSYTSRACAVALLEF